MNKIVKNAIKAVVPIEVIRFIRGRINQAYINKMGRESRVPYNKYVNEQGINLIGSFKHGTGLGQSVRLVEKSIEYAGIPHTLIDFSMLDIVENDFCGLDSKIDNKFKYGINIWHINMHEFFIAYKKFGKDKFDNRYNIAFWLWEMQEFPKEWIPMINILDEIWTPSEFISATIRKYTDKPVVTMPYALEAPYEEKYNRSYFNLPEDKFLFLMMYDTNSNSERKNPDAVINAFKKAFKDDSNVALVIKVGHCDKELLDKFNRDLRGFNYIIIDKRFSKVEVNSLIRSCDVFVSLHRAEGFGLVLSEAMLLGVPTVATKYSANVEFQNEDVACMVGYELKPIGKTMWPYKKSYLWADPHIDEAKEYMIRLKNDKEFYSDKKEKAQKYIEEILCIKNISDKIKSNIKRIEEN